jgi:nucleoside-diphosphate-sugar epimerase
MRIFVAGAAGAIGRRLTPLLVADGHQVVGTTRSPEKAGWLRDIGAEAVKVDALDGAALTRAAVAARPDVIMNQLTDLPAVIDSATWDAVLARNAAIRIVSAPALMAAARQAGARRYIIQSIAFAYAPDLPPLAEEHPIDPKATGVRAVEAPLAEAGAVTVIVLRNGHFYGPGTWASEAGKPPSVHVDAAVHAAFLAVNHGGSGAYNIADDDGAVVIAKARRDLGWEPTFRLPG